MSKTAEGGGNSRQRVSFGHPAEDSGAGEGDGAPAGEGGQVKVRRRAGGKQNGAGLLRCCWKDLESLISSICI